MSRKGPPLTASRRYRLGRPRVGARAPASARSRAGAGRRRRRRAAVRSGSSAGESARSATARNAASGASPMSSDSARSTPSSAATSRTVSQTSQSGVVAKSSRFIDTWARPSSSIQKPLAWTLRQAAARLADPAGDPLGELDVARVEVDVVGDEERPGTDRDGTGRRVEPRRPEVRLAAVGPISAFRPSYWPRRTSASLTRSGRVAALAYRKTGRSKAVAIRSPNARASSTQSSIVVAASGTNGMTSTAPMRGCSPVWVSMSISWIAAATRRSSASITGPCSPAIVNTDRLWLASLVRSRR